MAKVMSREELKPRESGFTLIEVIVVVAILAILAVIALQTYSDQVARSNNNACLAEAKYYVNVAAAAFYANLDIPEPTLSACQSIETVVNLNDSIEAVAKEPGGATIVCDMSGIAICVIQP